MLLEMVSLREEGVWDGIIETAHSVNYLVKMLAHLTPSPVALHLFLQEVGHCGC